MAEENYAFIKGIDVVNVVVFDDPTDSLLDHFKEAFGVDSIVPATTSTVIGGTYTDGVFWAPQPYPSWTQNYETNTWDAPVPFPNDLQIYTWNEDTLSWDLEQVEPGEQP